MPVYLRNTFVERIPNGFNQEMVRRVYNGNNELLYGLYDLTYYDRYDIYTPLAEELRKGYAGGRNRYLPGIESNYEHFCDYFEDYRTHYDGGYGVYDYLEEMPGGPGTGSQYVEAERHEDLFLYAKGRQKQFRGAGSFQYTRMIGYGPGEGPGGGGGSVGTFSPLPCPSGETTITNGAYFKTNGGADTLPGECTWVVRCRLNAIFGYEKFKTRNASQGLDYSGYETGTTPKPGAVACWRSIPHVAFVEKVDADGSPYFSQLCNHGGHDGSKGTGATYWVSKTGNQSGGRAPDGYVYVVGGSPTPGPTPEPSSEGYYVEETFYGDDEGICDDQNNPSFPSYPPHVSIPEDAYGFSGTSQTYYTDERIFVYNKDGGGDGGEGEELYSSSSDGEYDGL